MSMFTGHNIVVVSQLATHANVSYLQSRQAAGRPSLHLFQTEELKPFQRQFLLPRLCPFCMTIWPKTNSFC